jgi:hypothetical protein
VIPDRAGRLAVAAVALLLVILPACGSGAGPAPSASVKASTPFATAGYGLVPVTPASIPSEPTAQTSREARSPDPAFDYGFVVQITPTGFHPAVLVAACCTPIVWVNLTDKPNSVVFDVEAQRSGPIPPGASWTFTPPNAESIAYHSATYSSMTGAVQVNQTTD